jgi:hypothetical protein
MQEHIRPPASGAINPKPRSALHHFSFPAAILFCLFQPDLDQAADGFRTRGIVFLLVSPFVDCAGQRVIHTEFISHRSMADGPRLADVIQQSLIGRVIGIYETAQEPLKIAGGQS